MAKSKKFTKSQQRKEQEKRQKKRIILLILLVLVMIGMLSASSFAWFSSNKHATIDSIDINVATITGLQVSADAINWDNFVSKEQIINAPLTYPRAINQLPDTLANVSTAGNIGSDGTLDMFYGITTEERNGGFTLTTIKQEEMECTGDEECIDKHYIAFDIFLLTTTPAQIGITANSSVLPQPDAENKGAQNAARIGFVIEGSVAAGNPGAAQNLRANGGKAYIWEPNYDMHSNFGIINARDVYGINTSASGAARIAYKGVNQEFATPVYIDQTDRSSYFTSVNPNVATPQRFEANQYLMSIPAGITKVRVYMWLEGQDVDMENYAAESKLRYDLELAMLN
jgi:hypothetical protein